MRDRTASTITASPALAGCNNALPVPQEPSVQQFNFTTSVTVASTDTRSSIEGRYSGEVIV